MFYSYKLIENAGFKSVEEFVEYYFKRHKNCCFKHTPKGIFLDYDFDTDKITNDILSAQRQLARRMPLVRA